MTKNQINQLLYLENRAVDHDGRINMAHCNAHDRRIMAEWNRTGYILTGRIVEKHHNRDGTHWCHLSDEAWADAAKYRRQRAERTWANKDYETTDERAMDIITTTPGA